LLHIDKPVRYAVRSKDIRIWFLADLTLKLLPGVRNEILLLLLGHFLLEPVLKTLVMNVSHGAIALATIEERIL
jgi:hypothetical protein